MQYIKQMSREEQEERLSHLRLLSRSTMIGGLAIWLLVVPPIWTAGLLKPIVWSAAAGITVLVLIVLAGLSGEINEVKTFLKKR